MKYFPIVFLSILFTSCNPKVYFFGDSYPTTQQVDTYYSADDINVKYKVIGQLKGYPGSGKDIREKVKLEMLKEAKIKGANGILFLLNESHSTDNTLYPIKADLLLYEK